MTITSTTRWRLAAVASIAIFGAILAFAALEGGRTEFRLDQFTLVESAVAAEQPQVSQAVAADATLQKLTELNGSVHGLALSQQHFSSKLTAIKDEDGNLVYTTTEAQDSWVIQYTAPAQNGFKNMKGLVVVDATTGDVDSAQLLQWN
jgi:hypothetical protein